MELIETDILSGKRIDCYIDNVILNKESGNIKINIVKVEKFYDYNLGDFETNYNIENGILHFKIEFNNVSNGELFIITKIIIDNSYIIGKGSTDFPLGYILIDKNNEIKKAEELFKLNRKNREDIFNTPVGDINENNNYQVMIFCKNIYIQFPAQYGQIEIIPYKNLSYESEIRYINNFFCNVKSDFYIDLDEKEILESHFRPSAVIHIPNIKANNIKRAEEISINNANILVNIFSLLKKSHREFFCYYY